MADGGVAGYGYEQYSSAQQERSPAFVAQRKAEREAAIARGEDPYEDFKKRVAERGPTTGTEKLWRKLTGKDRKGADVVKKEGPEALREGRTDEVEEQQGGSGGKGKAEYQALGKFGNGELDESDAGPVSGSVEGEEVRGKKKGLFGRIK